MCGILGIVGTRWRDSAESALTTLRNRGPDEQTYTRIGEVVLAHTRLAVIDLTGGHQPMQTADGRYTVVFNGEIYNAPELRSELEARGEQFVSDHSDTEVVLLGYRAWGEALLHKLDGMFAFAIWDAHERTLFAARDKLGIKPFMYAAIDSGFIFASTVAPFFALPGFPRKLDPEALRDYLAFQTPLAPHTFLKDVRQLPPANCLYFSAPKNQLQIKRWWSIPRPEKCSDDRETLLARVDSALRSSVRRQMAADVPLGAFLSGGIDSSLMVRYLSEESRRPVETFTLKFAEQGFDESRHAAEVARQFGCRHHVLEAPSLGADDFVAAIRDLDQPLADPAYVMTHALSRLTRQHVTVAISGDGGDELFGGYPRFLDTEDRHPAKFWQPLVRAGIEAGVLPSALLRRTLNGRELLHYRRVELGPWSGRKDIRKYVRQDFLKSLAPDKTLGSWLNLVDEQGGVMDSSTLMRADLWTYLSENCLTKTDRASMAHGLEVRVPLLGQPVVDLALSLDASIHLQDGFKSLLTTIATRHLPECVWGRKKQGFSVPLVKRFNEAWQTAGDNAVHAAAKHPFLNHQSIEKLWLEAKKGKASGRLAYTFLVLLLWLEGKDISC